MKTCTSLNPVSKADSGKGNFESIFEDMRTYNEQYGMDIENLIDVLQRQMDHLYQLSDKIQDEKLQEETVFTIGQNETLLKLIKERAGWNVFHKISSSFHQIQKERINI